MMQADSHGSGDIAISLEPAGSVDASWCLGKYQAELVRRFETGFDPRNGNSLEPADVTPPKGWFLVARKDGRPIGCGALKRLDASTAEIKRVWVDDSARGLRVASRLMDRLEELASEAGFARVVLDTNRTLVEARAMYARRGYAEIGSYNDNPYADYWFEKRL